MQYRSRTKQESKMLKPTLLTPARQSSQVTLFLYGESGVQKTTWASKILGSGLNVVVLDGDNSSHIYNQIDPKQKERLYFFDLIDKGGKAERNTDTTPSTMANFLMRVKDKKEFKYDLTQRREVAIPSKDSETIIWKPKDILTHDTVLIIDSWTAFVSSLVLRFYNAHDYDGYASMVKDKQDMKLTQEHYQWCGAQALCFAAAVKTLGCHVICIGHDDKVHTTDKVTREITSTKTALLGVSRPNAHNTTKEFHDFFYMHRVRGVPYVQTAPKGDVQTQSRTTVIPPGDYDAQKELTVLKLFEKHNALPKDGREVKPLTFA